MDEYLIANPVQSRSELDNSTLKPDDLPRQLYYMFYGEFQKLLELKPINRKLIYLWATRQGVDRRLMRDVIAVWQERGYIVTHSINRVQCRRPV